MILMRPALYNAQHRIIPLNKNNKNQKKFMNLLVPICESTDKFSSKKNFKN